MENENAREYQDSVDGSQISHDQLLKLYEGYYESRSADWTRDPRSIAMIKGDPRVIRGAESNRYRRS